MDGTAILKIRKGLNGYPFSVCTEEGNFIGNAESIDEIRSHYKVQIQMRQVKFRKELSLFPKGYSPNYKKYGYACVSQRNLDAEENNMQVQEQILKEAGAETVYREILSEKTSDRPVLNELVNFLKGGDMLIIPKLECIAGTINESEAVISQLYRNRVSVNILNIGVIDHSPFGNRIYQIFQAFVETERNMISEYMEEEIMR